MVPFAENSFHEEENVKEVKVVVRRTNIFSLFLVDFLVLSCDLWHNRHSRSFLIYEEIIKKKDEAVCKNKLNIWMDVVHNGERQSASRIAAFYLTLASI